MELSVLRKLQHQPWRLLLAGRTQALRKSDVLLAAYSFSFRDSLGRLYSTLFDSCREALEGYGVSVQMVALRGEPYPRARFAGGHVPSPASPERGKLIDAVTELAFNGRVRTRFEERAWIQVLEGVQPQVVIAQQPSPSLCRAGRDRGIEVFDLQHGHITEGHRYYYNLNRPQRVHKNEWPSGVLCWDQRSAEVVNRNLQPRTTGRVVGHPWLTRFMSPNDDHNSDTVVARAIAEVDELLQGLRKPLVLVTLQWNPDRADRSGLTGALLPAPLNDLICRTREMFWLVWPHPAQVRESLGKVFDRIDDVFSSCETVITGHAREKLALPALLSRSVAHVTVTSSSVEEATLLGVPSWRFTDSRSPLVDPLVRTGADVQALEKWLSQLVQRQDAEASALVSGRLDELDGSFAERLLRACALSPLGSD